MRQTKLIGIDRVMANLNKEMQQIKGRSIQGLIAAGAYVRRDMDKVSPRVPVDTRNLDHSFFMTTALKSEKVMSDEGRFVGERAGELSSGHSAAKMAAQAVARGARQPLMIMGFSANYAAKVHETDRPYKRPGSGAKFFESALDRNTKKIIEIIGNYAKVK
jgi:hypothetical protein